MLADPREYRDICEDITYEERDLVKIILFLDINGHQKCLRKLAGQIDIIGAEISLNILLFMLGLGGIGRVINLRDVKSVMMLRN